MTGSWFGDAPQQLSERFGWTFLVKIQQKLMWFDPLAQPMIFLKLASTLIFNGDVFCCDFFVDEQWKLGNIMGTQLDVLFAGKRKSNFAWAKWSVGNKCLVCRHKAICRGGCLKERLVLGAFNRESCFCESYKQFFDYAMPKFMQIAAQVK